MPLVLQLFALRQSCSSRALQRCTSRSKAQCPAILHTALQRRSMVVAELAELALALADAWLATALALAGLGGGGFRLQPSGDSDTGSSHSVLASPGLLQRLNTAKMPTPTPLADVALGVHVPTLAP